MSFFIISKTCILNRETSILNGLFYKPQDHFIYALYALCCVLLKNIHCHYKHMLFPLQHSSRKIPGHVDGRALSKGCMVLLKLWGKIYIFIYIYVFQRDPCMLSRYFVRCGILHLFSDDYFCAKGNINNSH